MSLTLTFPPLFLFLSLSLHLCFQWQPCTAADGGEKERETRIALHTEKQEKKKAPAAGW